MDQDKDIQKELEGLSPELARLRERQNQPFSTPENYFGQMPSDMQEYVRAKTRKRGLSWAPSGIRQWIPVAATVMLLAIGISMYFLMRPGTDKIAYKSAIEVPASSEAASEEIILDELDEEFLVEALAMAEPARTAKEGEAASQANETQVREEIEEYILENFDESILTEEL